MNLKPLFGAAFLTLSLNLVAQEPPLLPIGAARADITPGYPIRLHGYGGRTTNSQGFAQKIWAKALAFGTDADGPRILITLDNLGVPGRMTDELAARLASKGIKRDGLAICASHTHSAPLLTGVAPNIFSSDIIPAQQATIDRYTRDLVDKLEQLALAALTNRAPSKLSWSEGIVTFAKNRRVIRGGRAQFGENNTAPVDHSLPTLFVRSPDNQIRAVLVNYACHCTTLGGEWNRIHGDWAGCAQQAIELENPGAIALVSIGCGADANPSPRGTVDNAQAHGDEIAAEVRRLLALPSKALTRLPAAKLKRFELDFDPLPTEQQWKERAQKPGIVGYHAKKNLARLARGEALPTKLPYSVQSWVFGDDLAMVFLPGEVVVDYELRLKREFDAARLWVNGYANDAPCYIPSQRILSEGGYEAEDSLWYYDQPARLAMSSEDRIVSAVHELLPRQFLAKTNRAEAPRPLSPQEALNSIRVAPEFSVELAAAEPLVVDPVAIDWGADAKLWVVEMHDYPMGMDGNWKPGGRVKFLQDTNSDGRYDTSTLFLDGLPFPTGVFAWRRGALVCAAPDILYAEDTNGDGRADVVQKIFTGFATDNYQARVNSLSLGLDGWIYGANGLLGGKIRYVGGTNSTSAPANGNTGNPFLQPLKGELDIRGRDFRMNPDTGAFEPASGLTQQGRVRDDFGNWFGCDNSRLLLHYPLADEYVRRNPHVAAPNATVHVPQGHDWNRLYPASRALERFNDPTHVNRVTSACGLEIYRDELLGPEFHGNAFTCEPVHNLVHREVLQPNGVTFRSARATNEASREFLASTDNWFRPVQARTGPDGALWVVDMYRHVIEHPRWIPSNRLAQLDVRAGQDKGRIYRVHRRGTEQRRIRDFTRFSTTDLASAINSSNGTERDIIHRELLNREDRSAETILLSLATNSPRAAVRVQVLATLAAWDAVTPRILDDCYARETDPQARAEIVRIARHALLAPGQIANAARDSDIRVRHQAALGLTGLSRDPDAIRALLAESTSNQWMRAAVLSAASNSAATLLADIDTLPESAGRNELFRGLLATVAGTSSHADRMQAVRSLVPRNLAEATTARFDALVTLAKNAAEELWNTSSIQEALRFARTIANAEDEAVERRRAAFRFAMADPTAGSELEWARPLLKPGIIQSTAIEALLRRMDPAMPPLLFAEWSSFSPEDRSRIVERLASTSDSTPPLLDALESKTVSPAEVSVLVRSRLLNDTNAVVKERAVKLWPARASNRHELITQYRKEVGNAGDSQRGAHVFDNQCAACHAFNGRGTAIGPDLAPWRNKTVDDFLLGILDPNAAIEPRYVNYIVETKKGGFYYGVIRSETATSIELISPGLHEKLLRGDLVKIQASATSLMPEGLEQVITPAEMNDLIAFLRKPAPRAFGRSSTEQIRAAQQAFFSQKPNGSTKLLFASEQLEYPSWLGRLPLHHCRQTDGKSRVIWETTLPPSSGNEASFVLAAAMGLKSQPGRTFVLSINGKPAVEFDVTLTDGAWESADGRVQLKYLVMEANAEDSNGALTISMPRELAKAPVRFEVTGAAAGSQRWFGIYNLTEKLKLAADELPR